MLSLLCITKYDDRMSSVSTYTLVSQQMNHLPSDASTIIKRLNRYLTSLQQHFSNSLSQLQTLADGAIRASLFTASLARNPRLIKQRSTSNAYDEQMQAAQDDDTAGYLCPTYTI